MAIDDTAYITWKNDFEVGIPEVDRQHMRLVGLINELYIAMEVGTTTETEKVLQGVLEYTVTHFAAEEILQERHNYPGLVEHRQLHKDLVVEALVFQKRFHDGVPGVEASLMWFLKDWLLSHIKMQDAKFAKYILAK